MCVCVCVCAFACDRERDRMIKHREKESYEAISSFYKPAYLLKMLKGIILNLGIRIGEKEGTLVFSPYQRKYLNASLGYLKLYVED